MWNNATVNLKPMIEILSRPWPWYVAGPFITLVMFLLLYFGRNFGVSSTLRTTCAIVGAGRISDFFKFNWRQEIWNIIFIIGALIGGFIASSYFPNTEPISLNAATITNLESWGISRVGWQYLPSEIFTWEALMSSKGMIILVGGGFLVGFGSRYAGGCTSGHAISGLSDLQLPSLISVIGFFIGGMIMTFGILPHIMKL